MNSKELMREINRDEKIKEYYKGHFLHIDDYLDILVNAARNDDLDEIAHARDKLHNLHFIILRDKFINEREK